MFTQKRVATAREVTAAHDVLFRLLAERDSWYDGTVTSIDNRLAALHRALPLVERVASTDVAMLGEAHSLNAEIGRLSTFRDDQINTVVAHRELPHVSSVGTLSPSGRQWVAGELRRFMAENADAVGDLDELDTRAENHAELSNIQMPVTEARTRVAHFRLAVNWQARNEQRRQAYARRGQRQRTAGAAARHLAAVPDEALFD